MVELKLGLHTVDVPYTVRLYGITEKMFDEMAKEDIKAELIDGVMIVHSPKSLRHDHIAGFIRGIMRCYAEEKDLGMVLGPRSLINLRPGRRISPDVFFVARERVPRPLPRQLDLVPDLALEVLVPMAEPAEKRRVYKEAGAGEIWWVVPENKSIIVDRRGPKRYGTGIFGRGYVASAVLPGFRLDADWLWSDPLPNEMDCLRDLLH